MSSKSKTKGKSWERDVCLFLSELYDESFIRVPGSGAFIGGSNQFRKETLSTEQIKLSRGDIIPPNDYPYFLAECKKYADFPFHQLIGNNTIALLDSWIEQVEHDITADEDVWLLFIKITRKGQFVLFNPRHLTEKVTPLPLGFTGRSVRNPNPNDCINGLRYKKYWFCDMKHFFNCYKKELEIKWKGV